MAITKNAIYNQLATQANNNGLFSNVQNAFVAYADSNPNNIGQSLIWQASNNPEALGTTKEEILKNPMKSAASMAVLKILDIGAEQYARAALEQDVNKRDSMTKAASAFMSDKLNALKSYDPSNKEMKDRFTSALLGVSDMEGGRASTFGMQSSFDTETMDVGALDIFTKQVGDMSLAANIVKSLSSKENQMLRSVKNQIIETEQYEDKDSVAYDIAKYSGLVAGIAATVGETYLMSKVAGGLGGTTKAQQTLSTVGRYAHSFALPIFQAANEEYGLKEQYFRGTDGSETKFLKPIADGIFNIATMYIGDKTVDRLFDIALLKSSVMTNTKAKEKLGSMINELEDFKLGNTLQYKGKPEDFVSAMLLEVDDLPIISDKAKGLLKTSFNKNAMSTDEFVKSVFESNVYRDVAVGYVGKKMLTQAIGLPSVTAADFMLDVVSHNVVNDIMGTNVFTAMQDQSLSKEALLSEDGFDIIARSIADRVSGRIVGRMTNSFISRKMSGNSSTSDKEYNEFIDKNTSDNALIRTSSKLLDFIVGDELREFDTYLRAKSSNEGLFDLYAKKEYKPGADMYGYLTKKWGTGFISKLIAQNATGVNNDLVKIMGVVASNSKDLEDNANNLNANFVELLSNFGNKNIKEDLNDENRDRIVDQLSDILVSKYQGQIDAGKIDATKFDDSPLSDKNSAEAKDVISAYVKEVGSGRGGMADTILNMVIAKTKVKLISLSGKNDNSMVKSFDGITKSENKFEAIDVKEENGKLVLDILGKGSALNNYDAITSKNNRVKAFAESIYKSKDYLAGMSELLKSSYTTRIPTKHMLEIAIDLSKKIQLDTSTEQYYTVDANGTRKDLDYDSFQSEIQKHFSDAAEDYKKVIIKMVKSTDESTAEKRGDIILDNMIKLNLIGNMYGYTLLSKVKGIVLELGNYGEQISKLANGSKLISNKEFEGVKGLENFASVYLSKIYSSTVNNWNNARYAASSLSSNKLNMSEVIQLLGVGDEKFIENVNVRMFGAEGAYVMEGVKIKVTDESSNRTETDGRSIGDKASALNGNMHSNATYAIDVEDALNMAIAIASKRVAVQDLNNLRNGTANQGGTDVEVAGFKFNGQVVDGQIELEITKRPDSITSSAKNDLIKEYIKAAKLQADKFNKSEIIESIYNKNDMIANQFKIGNDTFSVEELDKKLVNNFDFPGWSLKDLLYSVIMDDSAMYGNGKFENLTARAIIKNMIGKDNYEKGNLKDANGRVISNEYDRFADMYVQDLAAKRMASLKLSFIKGSDNILRAKLISSPVSVTDITKIHDTGITKMEIEFDEDFMTAVDITNAKKVLKDTGYIESVVSFGNTRSKSFYYVGDITTNDGVKRLINTDSIDILRTRMNNSVNEDEKNLYSKLIDDLRKATDGTSGIKTSLTSFAEGLEDLYTLRYKALESKAKDLVKVKKERQLANRLDAMMKNVENLKLKTMEDDLKNKLKDPLAKITEILNGTAGPTEKEIAVRAELTKVDSTVEDFENKFMQDVYKYESEAYVNEKKFEKDSEDKIYDNEDGASIVLDELKALKTAKDNAREYRLMMTGLKSTDNKDDVIGEFVTFLQFGSVRVLAKDFQKRSSLGIYNTNIKWDENSQSFEYDKSIDEALNDAVNDIISNKNKFYLGSSKVTDGSSKVNNRIFNILNAFIDNSGGKMVSNGIAGFKVVLDTVLRGVDMTLIGNDTTSKNIKVGKNDIVLDYNTVKVLLPEYMKYIDSSIYSNLNGNGIDVVKMMKDNGLDDLEIRAAIKHILASFSIHSQIKSRGNQNEYSSQAANNADRLNIEILTAQALNDSKISADYQISQFDFVSNPAKAIGKMASYLNRGKGEGGIAVGKPYEKVRQDIGDYDLIDGTDTQKYGRKINIGSKYLASKLSRYYSENKTLLSKDKTVINNLIRHFDTYDNGKPVSDNMAYVAMMILSGHSYNPKDGSFKESPNMRKAAFVSLDAYDTGGDKTGKKIFLTHVQKYPNQHVGQGGFAIVAGVTAGGRGVEISRTIYTSLMNADWDGDTVSMMDVSTEVFKKSLKKIYTYLNKESDTEYLKLIKDDETKALRYFNISSGLTIKSTDPTSKAVDSNPGSVIEPLKGIQFIVSKILSNKSVKFSTGSDKDKVREAEPGIKDIFEFEYIGKSTNNMDMFSDRMVIHSPVKGKNIDFYGSVTDVHASKSREINGELYKQIAFKMKIDGREDYYTVLVKLDNTEIGMDIVSGMSKYIKSEVDLSSNLNVMIDSVDITKTYLGEKTDLTVATKELDNMFKGLRMSSVATINPQLQSASTDAVKLNGISRLEDLLGTNFQSKLGEFARQIAASTDIKLEIVGGNLTLANYSQAQKDDKISLNEIAGHNQMFRAQLENDFNFSYKEFVSMQKLKGNKALTQEDFFNGINAARKIRSYDATNSVPVDIAGIVDYVNKMDQSENGNWTSITAYLDKDLADNLKQDSIQSSSLYRSVEKINPETNEKTTEQEEIANGYLTTLNAVAVTGKITAVFGFGSLLNKLSLSLFGKLINTDAYMKESVKNSNSAIEMIYESLQKTNSSISKDQISAFLMNNGIAFDDFNNNTNTNNIVNQVISEDGTFDNLYTLLNDREEFSKTFTQTRNSTESSASVRFVTADGKPITKSELYKKFIAASSNRDGSPKDAEFMRAILHSVDEPTRMSLLTMDEGLDNGTLKILIGAISSNGMPKLKADDLVRLDKEFKKMVLFSNKEALGFNDFNDNRLIVESVTNC